MSGPAASTAMTGRPTGPHGPQRPKRTRVTQVRRAPGATAASLASGDPNCPDGAPVTDGTETPPMRAPVRSVPAGPRGSASIDSGLPEVTASSSNGYTREEGNTAGP
jgi:hypothetical protein